MSEVVKIVENNFCNPITKIEELLEKIKKLQEEISFLKQNNEENLRRSANSGTHNKQPHVCPVCLGNGESKDIKININTSHGILTYNEKCSACLGACVLWG